VDITPSLVAIARDQNRPLDTRRSALSWLARDDATNSSAEISRATDLLLNIARDENETQSLRRTALNQLGRVGHGAGVPALVRLATDNSAWTGDESLRALAQSGDPRAREFLRTEVRRTDLPDATLTVAIRGLGGSQATGQDITLLRNTFATTPGDRARAAIMEVISQRGTASDTKWLLDIARDTNQPVQTRRRALDLAARGTAGSTQALALYDTMNDQTLKGALIQIYAQNNDRASVDKLISIAKTDTDYTLRRRAIASLSRTQDPRARQALVELTNR
jgi:HEAT repeat protein